MCLQRITIQLVSSYLFLNTEMIVVRSFLRTETVIYMHTFLVGSLDVSFLNTVAFCTKAEEPDLTKLVQYQ